MTTDSKTIVLIHGMWVTPRSWDPFRRFYEQHGYRVLTPAWPGMADEVEDVRRDPSPLNGLGLIEVADHIESLVRSLGEPPILMGHSAGGLVVQILLDRGLGAVGVAIDSVAPKGVLRLPFSVLRAGRPVLSNPFNYGRTVAFTFPQFRYAFANTFSLCEARSAYEQFAVPAPGRPIFQIAFANFNRSAATQVNYANNRRAPLLLIAGSDDHLAPASMARINYANYARSTAITAYKEFPRRSHLIVVQEGWEEVAGYALSWAEAHSGGGRTKIAAAATNAG